MALSPDEIRSIIQAFTEGTTEQQQALEQLQEVTDRRLQSLQQEFDAIQRLLDARNAERASLEAQIDIAQRAAAAAATETARRQANTSAVQAQIDQLNHLAQAEAASTEEIQAQTDALMTQNVATANSAGGYAALAAAISEAMEARMESTRATEKDTKAKEESQSRLASLSRVNDSLLGGLVGQIKVLKQIENLEQARAFTMAQAANLVFKLAEELYAAEAAFRKTTGATREFSSDIGRSFEMMRGLGVTIEDVSNAQTSLYRNFTDFKFATRDARGTLVNTAGLLSRLGVSTDDFSKGLQTQVKAFGMTEKAGATAFLEITHFAREAGIPVDMLSSQYAAMSPKLAKLGDAGHKAFMDLARVSAITGLEMQKVLAITDKFDTFEGAAEQAGKLNAALGGNFVNAMELMMDTDPVSRFNQIREAILNQGLAFDDMSYYQRKFFTESIDGLETEADLAALLSNNMDMLASSTKMTTEEALELKKAAQDTQNLQEALKSLVASVTPIITPMIEHLTKFIQELTASEETVENLQTALRVLAGGQFLKWAFTALKALRFINVKMVAIVSTISLAIEAFQGLGRLPFFSGFAAGGTSAAPVGSEGFAGRALSMTTESLRMIAPQGGDTNVNNAFNPNVTVNVGGEEVAAVVEKKAASRNAIDAFSGY